MTNSCGTVAPGQIPTGWQKTGLDWVARLQGKRDVVLAIDLTESVGLNDEGKIRLRQIIEDSLKPGDTVYVVPFAFTVNPIDPNVNSFANPVEYQGRKEDIDLILQRIPFQPDLSLRQTDIQLAELYIYKGLAQLNQCRLGQNQAVNPQAVVWLTDAPLGTEAGITSDKWPETPADSPFRRADSAESQERKQWLETLPLKQRSREITTEENQKYQLTVVDIAPTVQEFCTPAPGGGETCLVTPYLIGRLWLPASILFFLTVVASLVGFFGLKYLLNINKTWKLRIQFESDNQEEQICSLANNRRLAIGDTIYCPGSEIRGYLERKGNSLFLTPTKTAPIYYKGREITSSTKIESNLIRINCPDDNNKDFEIVIKLMK